MPDADFPGTIGRTVAGSTPWWPPPRERVAAHDDLRIEAERLAELQELWWREAEAHQALPLDDRSGERFAESAERFRRGRTDDESVGTMETDDISWLVISWSGLDIGFDRGTTVPDDDGSGGQVGPFAFTGSLVKVTVDLDDDRELDHAAAGAAELARE